MSVNTQEVDENKLIQNLPSTFLYRCNQCHLGYRAPSLDTRLLDQIYSGLSADRWQDTSQTNIAWKLARRHLEKWSPSLRSRRLLDVGAFRGGFIKSLPKNWTASAIEPAQEARQHLSQAGIEVLSDFLTKPADQHREAFDVVTLFDVFEHLPQPRQALIDAIAYLRPGGRLILSTGNMDHWSWKAVGPEHWYLATIQHICVGSIAYFRRIAQQLSLHVEAFQPHAHQSQTLYSKISQIGETLIFGGRTATSPCYRFLARGLLNVPGLYALRHRVSAPYAPAIDDHILVVLRKGEGAHRT